MFDVWEENIKKLARSLRRNCSDIRRVKRQSRGKLYGEKSLDGYGGGSAS